MVLLSISLTATTSSSAFLTEPKSYSTNETSWQRHAPGTELRSLGPELTVPSLLQLESRAACVLLHIILHNNRPLHCFFTAHLLSYLWPEYQH